MIKSPCSNTACSNLVNRGVSYCDSCSHLNPANQKKANSRYHTKAWRFTREQVLLRDDYLCVVCNQAATDVDHKIPWKEGGAFYDQSNLQSLCKQCHTRKTQHERTSS